MALTRSGAQRASRHRTFALSLVLALLAVIGTAPAPVTAVTNVEYFYLGLLNCTRTGGWVRKDGTCSRYGSGYYSAYVRPIRLSAGISNRVARPYARLLAIRGQCTHFLNGTNPGSRLKAAGYPPSNWAENIGCRDGYGSAYKAVLASHLYFQSEKYMSDANDGHWDNIKNRALRYVGVGISVYNGRTRLVVDFYTP